MSLKTKVLVFGVENLHAARYCAGVGVEIASFVISPNRKGYINPQNFKQIKGWLEGIHLFGEVDSLEDINSYETDGYLTSNESILPSLKNLQKPIIFRVNLEEKSNLSEILQKNALWADAFVLSTTHEILNKNSKLLQELSQQYRIFLNTEIQSDNVLKIVELFPLIEGIALESVEESQTGIINFEGFSEIFEALED
jgi:phosphoribosylanthranilate isomerase